ncbi:MAG: hypothetical protein JNK65_03515, partial [Deltaproteobacteria bacterium]|nr:hypothetical protein [Deltaproteobacteria bacterium]
SMSDEVENPPAGSLRLAKNGFNGRDGKNRECDEKIDFYPGTAFNIVLKGPLVFSALDLDSNNDGIALEITKGGASQVVIDGRQLGDNDCVLDISALSNVRLNGIKILAKKVEKAVCGIDKLKAGTKDDFEIDAQNDPDHDRLPDDVTGAGGDPCPGNPSNDCPGPAVCGNNVKEEGELCDGGPCCQAGCTLKGEGTPCGDGKSCNAAGSCESIPAPVTCGNSTVDTGEECDGGTCCNADCTFKDENASCDDGSATTTMDKCNATGVCAGTPVVPVCGNGTIEGTEECDGGTCCNTDCTAKDENLTCDDGNASTSNDKCNATGVCAGTAAPATCGNGTKDADEVCEGGTCCNADCTAKAENTACDDGNASTSNDKCNATAVCAGTPASTGGGTPNPGSGETPPTGGTPSGPDSVDTGAVINLGSGGGTGSCGIGLASGASYSSAIWMLLSMLIPHLVYRRMR